jgi:DnaK suppressor protein
MDAKQRQRFRKLLKEQRDALQLRLLSTRRPHDSTASDLKDEADRANHTVSTELTFLQQSQADHQLRAINAALDRIDAGTFGECLNCGQEIGAQRLQAVPWARYCITCQELLDQQR